MTEMQYLRVGRVLSFHGLQGEMKLQVISDDPEQRFAPQTQLSLQHDTQRQAVTVQTSRPYKGFWLVKFVEINDLTEAEIYRNWEVMIATDQLPPLPTGQYYYKDIMGIKVVDQQRGYLGQVSDILALGPNDVWVITNAAGQEILIPIIKTVLLQVNLSEATATVDLPEGLIDEN